MKKLLAAVLLLLCLTATCMAEMTTFSFGPEIRFSMTPAEVSACYPGKSPLSDETSMLVEDETCAGLNASVLFSFTEGRLSRIAVFFREARATDALCLADFDAIEATLSATFGEPVLRSEGDLDSADQTIHRQYACADGAIIWHTLYRTDAGLAHAVLCYAAADGAPALPTVSAVPET